MAKQKTLAWIVWGLAVSFYCYEFLLQVSPGVMVSDLMRAFKINAAQVGNLSAQLFYIYAGMQIPVGVLIDRYGPRRLLAFAAAICALGSFLFGSAHILDIACLGRMFIGLGAAFAAISCLKLAANWFPLNRFALLTGLTVMVGMLGAINGQAPLALLNEHLSWRQSMHALGIVGIVLAILIYLVVRDSPTQLNPKPTRISKHPHLWRGLKYIFSNKQTWIVSIYGGLMYAPTTAFAGLWGVPFLISAYHISQPVAAGMISFIFIGWVFGGPFWGWLSDRLQRRKLPLVISAIGALATMSCIIYVHNLPIMVMNSLLFGFGFLSGGFLPVFSIVKEINPPEHNAAALGFVNTLNMVGGAIAQPLIGYILDFYWSGQLESGARVYQLANFDMALSLLAIMLLCAILLLPFIKETYGKLRG
jgi:MFS family permease